MEVAGPLGTPLGLCRIDATSGFNLLCIFSYINTHNLGMRVQELRRTWTLTKSEVASGHPRALGLTAFPGRVQFTPPPRSLDHALEEGKVESFYSPFLKLTLCCLEQPSPLVCLCSPRAPSAFPTFAGGTVRGAWLEADPALFQPCTLKESNDERWKPGGHEKGHS